MKNFFFDLQRFATTHNHTANARVSGTSGDDIIYNGSDGGVPSDGENSTVEGGEGKDKIYNYGRGSSINGGAGDDEIWNYAESVTIKGSDGNDTITNEADDVDIDGEAGEDILHNSGSQVTINGGAGNDSITNTGANVLFTYKSGDGKDTINGFNATSTLKIGDGTSSYSASISGSDVIVNVDSGSVLLIGANSFNVFNNIQGNETPYWTLSGTTATYGNHSETLVTVSGVKSESGLVANTTDKKVTVSNAALNQGTVTISDGYNLALATDVTKTSTVAASWNLSGTTATYKNASISAGYKLENNQISYVTASGGEQFTISGLNSSVSLGTDVMVTMGSATATFGFNANALVKENLTITSPKDFDTRAVLASDVDTIAGAITESLSVANGTATYQASGTDDYYSASGAVVTYTAQVGGEIFTINGLGNGAALGNDNVKVENNAVKIYSKALSTSHETISLEGATGYSLAVNDSLVADIFFNQSGNSVTLSGTAAGYKKVGDNYEWQDKVRGETLTITGLKDGATLTESMFTRGEDGKITFKPTQALLPDNPTMITISNGVIDTSGLTVTPAEVAKWNGNIYVSAKTASSWTNGAASVTYTKATGGENQFTVSGLKSGADVTTLTPDASGKINLTTTLLPDATATKLELTNVITGGNYQFVLPSGVSLTTTGETVAATFAGTGTYTYTSAYNKEFYSGSGTAITYNAATTPTKFTISGLKNGAVLNTDVVVSGDTVTVNASAIEDLASYSGTAITLSDGGTTYTKLALADTLTKKNSHAAVFTNSGTTFTYKGAYDDAYFSGNGTTYTYNKSTENAAKTFEVTNLKAAPEVSAFDDSTNTLTLTDAYLNAGDVTISTGYKLALDKDYSAKATVAHFDGLTYKSASNTAGYELKDGAIKYTVAVDETTLFTLAGVKNTDGITIDNGTVTIKEGNLNGEDVTISGTGYKLALDSAVKASTPTAAHFDGLTYKSASNTAGYALENGAIKYTAAVDETTLFTLAGVKNTDGITIDNGVVTIKEGNLNGEDVTITGTGYTLKLDDDIDSPSTTKAKWTFKDSTATYTNALTTAGYTLASDGKSVTYTPATGGDTLITVEGVKAKKGITLNDKVVTVADRALNGKNVKLTGDGYTLALADDVDKPSTTKAHWTHSGTTATYNSSSTSAGYTLAAKGKSITYSEEKKSTVLVTVKGVKSKDGLSLPSKNKVVTVTDDSLDSKNVTITGDGYTLKLGNDVKAPSTTKAHWEHNDTTATYVKKSTEAGYTLASDSKSITYTPETGGETLITVKGVKSKDGLKLNDKVVTVKASSLDEKKVTITGKGYTLKLGNDVDVSNKTDAHWEHSGTTATYVKASTSKGYTLASTKKSITYSNASGGETLITVKGVTSVSGLSAPSKTKVVTVSAGSLGKDNVTVTSKDYTLKLGGNVSKPTDIEANWTFSGSTAKYNSASKTAGYTLANDGKTIKYSAAKDATVLATVTGVKSADGLSVKNKVVTVAKDSLGTNKVTVSDGYTLALANDVTKSTTRGKWNFEDSTATYASTSVSEGYSLSPDKKSITHSKKSNGGNLVTVTGVTSTTGLTLTGTIVTVAKSALNEKTVKITKGSDYTLTLADDVAVPETTGKWKFNKSKSAATYTQTTSAGYTLAKNEKSITYSKLSSKDLITVSGIKSKDGLKLNDKVVTVLAASLDSKNVTISGTGYTLALADKVAAPETTPTWSFNKSTATCKEKTSAGYTLAKDKKTITYTKASTGDTLVTVTGVKSVDGLSLSNKVVTVKASALGTSKVTISDGYKLAFAANVNAPATTTDWSFSGSTATYKQKSTAGYTLSSDRKTITYSEKYTKDLIVVKGVKSLDGISLDGKVVTVSAKSLDKKNVTISKGYTLKLGSDVTKATAAKENWTTTGGGSTAVLNQTTSEGYTLANNTITYSKEKTNTLATINGIKTTSGLSVKDEVITLKNNALTSKVTVSGDYAFDFAAGYKNATITGSKGADVITTRGDKISVSGGKGSDSINVLGSATTVLGGAGKDKITVSGSAAKVTGGAGDDTIVSSGKGNVFVYASGDGKDVIADFSATDKLQITKGTAKVSVEGADVVVKVGSGSIKLTGAAGQDISIIDKNGNESVKKTTAPASDVAWFLEDDKQFTADNNLSAIVDDSADIYSLGDADDSTALIKEDKILTYTDKNSNDKK